MIPHAKTRPLAVLTILAALLTAFASVAGILHLKIYLPFTPEAMLPGTLSQDIVSLIAAVGLLVCLWLSTYCAGDRWACCWRRSCW